MTLDEVKALAQLLSRIPVTQAEVLWVNAILHRLTAEAEAKEAAQRREESTTPR